MEETINILMQALLGGAAGYITNEYAINMLFKSYTPLNIGGVIKKTRNEFIDNISKLVEDDLINPDKVKDILTDKSFVDNFKKLSESFYNTCLYEVTENIKVDEIDGYEETKDKLIKFANENLKDLLPQLIDEVDKKLDITKIITDDQISLAIDKSYEQLIELVQSKNLSKELISTYYQEYKYRNVTQLLGNEITDIVSKNTSSLINSLDKSIRSEYDNLISETLSDIYDKLNIGHALGAFTEELRKKSLSDILNSNAIGLKNRISIAVNSYIETDKCSEIIDEFSDYSITYLKNIDLSIFDILSDESIKTIEQQIRDTTPYILSYFSSFCEYNKAEIESLIQEAVDEVVASKNNPLLNMAKNNILSNVAQKYNIIQMVQQYLSGSSTVSGVSDSIIDNIIFYLKSTSIGNLVVSLEDNKFLTKEFFAENIKEYLLQNSNTIIDNIYQRLTNLSLHNIDSEKSHIISDFIKDSIIKVCKESLIYNLGTDIIKSKALTDIDKILTTDLNELISDKQIDKINFNNLILDTLNRNENKIKSLIHNLVSDKLNTQQLSSIFGDNYKEDAFKRTLSFTNKTIKNTLNDIGSMETKDVIDRLNNIDNLSVSTEELIRKLIINNIDNILGGSIKAIAVSNLSKLNDDELCDMAHDFIGRQLQPIMIFGGILGVIAGTGLGIYNPNINFLTPFSLNSTVTYGLVGYATNAIAINMLFRPYTEKKFLKKIPLFKHFALGYIVKNKNVLADSMTVLINDYLLNKNSVNELFDTYEEQIKESFFRTVSNDEYKVIADLSKNNEYALSDCLFDYVYGKYYDYEASIIEIITNKISDTQISTIINDKSRPFAHSYIKRISTDYIRKSEENIYTFLMSGKSLHDVLPEFITDAMSDKLMNVVKDTVYNTPSYINYDNAKELLTTLEPKYKILLDKKLKEIIPSSKLDNVMVLLNNLIIKSVESEKLSNSISDLIVNKLDSLASSDISINDINDGMVSRVINNKIDGFFDNTLDNTVRISSKYTETVSNSIQVQINNSLNFFTKIAYSSINGDKLVEEIVSKLLIEKLPLYVEKNHTQMSSDIKDMISYRLSSIKLNDLSISPNKSTVDKITNKFMSEGKTHSIITETLTDMKDYISPQILELKVSNVLSPFGFTSIDEIFINYKTELTALFDSISTSAGNNINDINNILSILTQNIYYSILDSTRINDIFRGLKREDLSKCIDILLETTFNTPAYDKCVGSIYADIQKHTENLTITDFMDKDKLNHSVTSVLKKISSDDDVIYTLRQSSGKIIENSIQSNFDFVDIKTKDYISSIIIDGCILSLRNNMDSILKDIHFDEVAKEQINAMSPKKIHKMFDSFAGRYFGRLMFYGLGGAIFGINPIAGILLASGYGIKKLVDVNKAKKLKTE